MKTRLKKLVLIGLICTAALCLCWWFNPERDPLRTPARKAWKQKAIADITTRVANPAWLSNELASLTVKAGQTEGYEAWLSDSLILMKSGEWLCYTNICVKQPGGIHDLFIARGSDGTWYYSTFHFCIGMVVLRCQEQPEDLKSFCETYYVERFDGRSNECLKKTWPRKRTGRTQVF